MYVVKKEMWNEVLQNQKYSLKTPCHSEQNEESRMRYYTRPYFMDDSSRPFTTVQDDMSMNEKRGIMKSKV